MSDEALATSLQNDLGGQPPVYYISFPAALGI
jgi:hypothetical protein